MPHSPNSAAPASIQPPAGSAPLPRQRSRSSAFAAPLLAWIAVRRAATLHQVLSLWHSDARDPRHGWRVVRRMVEHGLLASRPLDPALGAVSRHVLTIGPLARPCLPPTWWHPDPWSEPRHMLEHRLQRTQLSVLLEPEGWEWIPRREVFDALRRAGLRTYRGRALNSDDHNLRRRIENHAPARLPCDAMVQRSSGRVLLVIEARQGLRASVSIGRLPAPLLQLVGRFDPVEIAILGADPTLTAAAEAALARSVERRRLPVTVRPIPHFRELRHPRRWVRMERSQYAAHGVPGPFPYRRPARNVSQMAAGTPR